MGKLDIDRSISSSDFRREVREVLNRVVYRDERVGITRRGGVDAVIISTAEMQAFQRLQKEDEARKALTSDVGAPDDTST